MSSSRARAGAGSSLPDRTVGRDRCSFAEPSPYTHTPCTDTDSECPSAWLACSSHPGDSRRPRPTPPFPGPDPVSGLFLTSCQSQPTLCTSIPCATGPQRSTGPQVHNPQTSSSWPRCAGRPWLSSPGPGTSQPAFRASPFPSASQPRKGSRQPQMALYILAGGSRLGTLSGWPGPAPEALPRGPRSHRPSVHTSSRPTTSTRDTPQLGTWQAPVTSNPVPKDSPHTMSPISESRPVLTGGRPGDQTRPLTCQWQPDSASTGGHAAHPGDSQGAPGSGDEGACATGPHGTPTT